MESKRRIISMDIEETAGKNVNFPQHFFATKEKERKTNATKRLKSIHHQKINTIC